MKTEMGGSPGNGRIMVRSITRAQQAGAQHHRRGDGQPQRQRHHRSEREEQVGTCHEHFADGDVHHARGLVDHHEARAASAYSPPLAMPVRLISNR